MSVTLKLKQDIFIGGTKNLANATITVSDELGASLLAENKAFSSPVTYTGNSNKVPAFLIVDANNTVIGILDPSKTDGSVISLGGGSSSSIGTITNPYDVVIYGATFSGCMAALAAKKCGATVLLIEPRDMVGGMVTNGIMFADAYVSGTKLRSAITGMTNRFYALLAEEYNQEQQFYFQSTHYSAESHRAQLVLDRMLTAAAITVHKFGQIVSGTKTITGTGSYKKLESVTFTNYGKIYSKQWHDASYTGDLGAESGITMVSGREASATYSEASQNAGTNVNGAQPAIAVDPFVTPGVSGSGLIKFIKPYAIKSVGSAETSQQASGFRIAITTNATDKIPFYTLWGGAANVEAPYAGYDPTLNEIARRNATLNGTGWTTINNVILIQSAIPSDYSGKRDGNHTGIMSLDYVDPDIWIEYLTATWTRRAEIEALVRAYTIGFIYFCLNDTSLPAAVRTSVGSYGLSAQEYNGDLPKYVYIRQGRRTVGDFVMTAPLLATAQSYTDPIAIGQYTFDNHICQYLSDGAKLVCEGGGLSGGSATGAKIPRRVLFPKLSELTNLTLDFCGSMSSAVFSSIRVEPTLGALGEAAGVINALAAKSGIRNFDVKQVDIVRAIDYYGLLNYGGATVTTESLTTSSTGDGTGNGNGGTYVVTGTWSVQTTGLMGCVAYLSTVATSAVNSIQCLPTFQRKGMHDVYVKWLDTVGIDPRGQPTVSVVASGVTYTPPPINQSNSGDGGDWFYLGTYPFNVGDTANNYVTITHNNVAAQTNLQAIKFIPSKSLTKLARSV